MNGRAAEVAEYNLNCTYKLFHLDRYSPGLFVTARAHASVGGRTIVFVFLCSSFQTDLDLTQGVSSPKMKKLILDVDTGTDGAQVSALPLLQCTGLYKLPRFFRINLWFALCTHLHGHSAVEILTRTGGLVTVQSFRKGWQGFWRVPFGSLFAVISLLPLHVFQLSHADQG